MCASDAACSRSPSSNSYCSYKLLINSMLTTLSANVSYSTRRLTREMEIKNNGRQYSQKDRGRICNEVSLDVFSVSYGVVSHAQLQVCNTRTVKGCVGSTYKSTIRTRGDKRRNGYACVDDKHIRIICGRKAGDTGLTHRQEKESYL